MAWNISPTPPAGESAQIIYQLDDLFELQQFSHTFSYEDDLEVGETYTVQITAEEDNPTVSINNAVISGYYSGCFSDYSIVYLSKEKKYITVQRFDDILNSREIVRYNPSMSQTKLFNYQAVAVGSLGSNYVLPFSITVTNNWTIGENALKAAVNKTLTDEEVR